MSFRVYGRFEDGREYVLRWDDPGPLAGDRVPLARAHELDGADVSWLPTGPFVVVDLNDETSSFVTALYLLDDAHVVGNPPPLPDSSLPRGAVG